MTLDPNGLDALVQAAKDRNVPLIDAKAIVRAYLVALASSPPVVPSGWVTVPVERTAAMHDAAQATTSALLTRGHTAQIWAYMLAASPSPPALDGAGRDAVLEEIAEWLEEQAEADFTMAEDTPEYSSDGYRLMLRRKWRKADAAAIRALKETR